MGKITKEQAEAVFETSTHQRDAIEDLYRLMYPDYNRIKRIKGHPKVGEELQRLLWDLAIEFDHKHHPDVFPGGAYLNYGFSCDRTLGPWEYSTEGVEVVYAEEEN